MRFVGRVAAALLVFSAAWTGSSSDSSGDGVDGGLDATDTDATPTGDAGGPGSTDAEPEGGHLTVNVAAPDGGVPSVTVTGPGGFSRTIGATTTLVGLGAGTYQIAVAPLRVPGAVVSTLYIGSASAPTADVTIDGTSAVGVSVNVTFARRKGTGALWGSATYNGYIFAYTDDQLASGDAAAPAVTIDAGSALYGPEAIAFDQAGNLWTPDFNGNRLLRYDVDLLDQSGSPPPSHQVTGKDVVDGTSTVGSLYDAVGVAFDAAGNLWVSTCGARQTSLQRLTAAQLGAGGAQSPDAMLRDAVVDGGASGHTVDCVYDLAFDHDGGLWYLNTGVLFSSGAASLGYLAAPATLTGLTHAPPDLLVTLPTSPAETVYGLAFDPSGRLWIGADTHLYRLAAIPKETRGVIAATAEVTLTAAGSATPLGNPSFDDVGRVWGGTNVLGIFSYPGALTATSTVAPGVTLTNVPSMDSAKLRFQPPPAGLPIEF